MILNSNTNTMRTHYTRINCFKDISITCSGGIKKYKRCMERGKNIYQNK